MDTNKSDVLKLISEIEKDPKVNLNVPAKLTEPDDLILAAKRALLIHNDHSKSVLEDDGLLINTGPLPIRVSPKSINRALVLYDTIIKVFRARGHQFIDGKVDVFGQKYELIVRETLKIIPNSYKKKPTGVLCLKVYEGFPRFEIYDSKNVLLESKISRVVAKLEWIVQDLLATWARNAKREEEEKAREQIKLDNKERREKELADFKLLLNMAHREFEAKIVRNYIQSVEDKAKQAEGITPDLEKWILWAREKADWYDPHIEKGDDLLIEVDRSTLTFKTQKNF
ncbi:MAG TPA: hypothetical protein PLJ60_06095 [Chryseolinea sp.]|nr:hypothetical protein [Chryseolinea sp.]